jgi:D-glycero-alpha-D-manno-heptose-7-phosphate kinase
MPVEQWRDASERVKQAAIVASAPCRVDCGGSTEHRLTGLLGRQWEPSTTTIALDLRTTVEIRGYQAGKILVESAILGTQEATPPTLPLAGPLGLIFAVLGYFGVHGIRVTVDAQAPIRSGMGGSGAATVAAIGALQELTAPVEGREQDLRRVALLAHHLEDALYNNTGLQDQATAAYGGVHLWRWRYADQLDFEGEKLLADPDALSPHVLVAYSGKCHVGNRNSVVLETFRQTGNLLPLREISAQARAMGQALRTEDYRAAARALSAEAEIRSRLLGGSALDEDESLMNVARDHECGARFAGHGGGGSLWAIGEAPAIAALRRDWERLLSARGSGFVFPPGLSHDGLRVSLKGQSTD